MSPTIMSPYWHLSWSPALCAGSAHVPSGWLGGPVLGVLIQRVRRKASVWGLCGQMKPD